MAISRKWCKTETLLLRPLIGRKWYTVCRIAPFPMTLSDLQDHSYVANLLKCDFSYSCAAIDKISSDSFAIAERLVSFISHFTFWATVCKTVRPMLSGRCLSVLSVTLVYCGQTVRWIKMKLGMQVGLVPGHIALYGDPAPPPPKGHSPQFSAHVRCSQTAGWIKTPLGIEVGLGQPRRFC